MLEELRDKIYAVYPRTKDGNSEEQIRGARVFVSEICQRYNSEIASAENEPEANQAAIRAEESAGKLRANVQQMAVGADESKEPAMHTAQGEPCAEELNEGEAMMRRRAVLILFVVAVVIYVITGVAYNVMY